MATLKTFQHLIPDALCYLALVWVISVVLILAQILIISLLLCIMAVGLYGSVNPDLPAELISGSGRLLLYSALVTRPWLVVIAVVQRMAVQWLENRTGQRDKIAQTAISVTLAGIAGTVYVFEGATSTPHPSRFFTTTSDDLYKLRIAGNHRPPDWSQGPAENLQTLHCAAGALILLLAWR